MKKEYIKPIIEIIDFQAKDAIMADDENEHEKVYDTGIGGGAAGNWGSTVEPW